MNARTDRLRTPLLIAAIALLLRMTVACIAYSGRDLVKILWPRGIEPLGIARSLLTGQGFSSPFSLPTGPTAFLPPVYPVMLAGIERTFGVATPASAWTILFMQCLFSAMTCIAIYFLAVETLDEVVAKRAEWIWALFPYAIILPTNIIWESSLSALVLVVGLYLFVRSQIRHSLIGSSQTGAFWALASLVNAALLLLLPALMIWTAIERRSRTRWILCAAASFFFFLLPWTARNYLVFHKLFPVRDNFALELWIGNHEGAINGWYANRQIHPAFGQFEVRHYQEVGELQYFREKGAVAKDYILQNPGMFIKNSLVRCTSFWLGNAHGVWLGIPLLSLAGLAGAVLLLRERNPWTGVYLIMLVVYPLPYYVTHADLRYRHPIEPILAIISAYAITAIQHRGLWNSRSQEKTAGFVARANR